MFKRFTLVSVGIIILIIAIFLFRATNVPDEKEQLIPIKIGYLAIAGSLPLFVAEQQHLFKEAGFIVELIRFNSSNEIVIAAATDRIDVIGIAATNAVLDAAAFTDKSFKVFLLNGYTKASGNEGPTDYLIGRPGMTMENLRGSKIAFFPGSISKVFAQLIFPKFGISVEEIEYIEMAPPNWQSALATGVIDAVTAVEPFAQQIIKSGTGEPLIEGYYAEVMPDVPLSGAWFVTGALTHEQEETIVKVYKNSLRYIEKEREEAVNAYANYTPMTPEIYQEIGLNRWRLISEPGAAQSFEQFILILSNAGFGAANAYDFIWQSY